MQPPGESSGEGPTCRVQEARETPCGAFRGRGCVFTTEWGRGQTETGCSITHAQARGDTR